MICLQLTIPFAGLNVSSEVQVQPMLRQRRICCSRVTFFWTSEQFWFETSGIILRDLLMSAVAVSLYYVLRCLRSTSMSELQAHHCIWHQN